MFELQANCGRRQRWRYWRVAAPLSVGVAYLGIYRIAGAGTSGSGLYIEPLGDPLGFFLIALQRLPMLVGNAVLMADAGLGVVWPLPMIVLGIGAIVTMTWLVVSVSRQMSTDEVQALRWLVPGAGLATLGVVGGAPGGRELAVAVIGFAPLFAITLRCGWAHFASAHGMKRWMGRMVIGLLAVAQYGLSPVVLMAMAHGFRQSVTETAAIAAQIARYTSHARQVVLLTGSDPSIWFYAFRRLRPANPDAGCWWVASAARGTHRITKTGPRRLRIELVDGELMNGAFERLLRAERYAIPIGFEVSQCGAKVRVAAVRKGNPYLLDIELSQEPGSPDLAMLVWRAGRVEQVTTDERSSVMVIPWSPGPMRLF